MVGREAERWEDNILDVAALTGVVLGGGLEREGVLRKENEILRVLVALAHLLINAVCSDLI